MPLYPLNIYDYKTQAHDLIEEIRWSGIPKDKIYKKLHYLLHCSPHDAHIGSMTTIIEVKRAISALKWMRRRYAHVKSFREQELFKSGHKTKLTLNSQ